MLSMSSQDLGSIPGTHRGRRGVTPTSRPPTSTCKVWQVHPHTYTWTQGNF